MKAVDIHAHISTREGIQSLFKYSKALMEYYMKQEVTPEQVYAMAKTDEQMAADFIAADVKGILVGWDAETHTGQPPISNDYLAGLVKRFPDTFIGAFACVDPWKEEIALQEAERVIKKLGMMGLKFQQAAQGFFPDDRKFYPLWEKCVELGVPVQFHTGTTGLGAGMPGGLGIRLQYTRPIPHLDNVAADFPDLKIIGLHPSWPWQEEMIAIAIHKSNVSLDLSGWHPKYFPESLKHEIRTRLKDRVMFGSDYPMFSHTTLLEAYEKEGYPDDILERIFFKNAQRILGLNL